MKNRPSIGNAELEILRFVSEVGEAPVRAIAEHFKASKGYVRPTVVKMLERLTAKGYLKRVEGGELLVYRSSATPEELTQGLIEDFIRGPLAGETTPVLAYLLAKDSIKQEDLNSLKDLIERLEKGGRE